jgi:hypothetical protein
MSRLEFLSRDEIPAHDLTIKQLAILVKQQRHFNTFEAALAADQNFPDDEASLISLAQFIAQVDARLDRFAAAAAAHVDPIAVPFALAISAKQRF